MTRDRIQRLRIKLEASRARIMERSPALSMLLMYLRFVAVPGIDRISSSADTVFFEPSFLLKLNEEETDFLLCHQMLHIILFDVWRRESLAYSNYHYACDIRINAALYKDGLAEEYYPHLGRIHLRLPGEVFITYNATPDEIVRLVPYDIDNFDCQFKHKFIVDSDVCWLGGSEFFGATVILEPAYGEYLDIIDSPNPADEGKMKALWSQRCASAMNVAEGGGKDTEGNEDEEEEDGIGSVAKMMERIVKGMRDSVVDWKKLLCDFISEEICDYSFSPPDRRFDGWEFFLPDFNESENTTREILFMVDTSGSVNDRQLSEVYSEIKGAIDQFGGTLNGSLGFFDCSLTPPRPMKSVEDLKKIVPMGGGGTDFSVVFDYVNSELRENKPACIIIFTDGMGDYPPERCASGIPVMWMISDPLVTPPFGKTVKIGKGIAEA